LPRQVIGDDVSRGLGVDRPIHLLEQIDRELLEHLGTHDTRSIAPQLLDERLRAFVLLADPTRRRVLARLSGAGPKLRRGCVQRSSHGAREAAGCLLDDKQKGLAANLCKPF
jgi:hypothetical protein